MPRLLMVTTVPDTLRAFLLPHANYFRERGWKVDAAAAGVSGNPDCVRMFDQTWNIPWSRNPLNPSNLLKGITAIKGVVLTQQYDIVHVHTPVAAFITRLALRGVTNRPRVIYTAHGFHFHRGGAPLQNAIFRWLERVAGPWTDFLTVMNEEDHEAARLEQFVPEERLRYIPGVGIDLREFAPANVNPQAVSAVRSELGLADTDILFTMIAAFQTSKRHCDALRALARLNRVDVHMALAGTGPLQTQMKALADELGVSKQVHFLGFRRDIPVLVRASRATMLPSEREGLPRSVMESLSLEVPVIGADARGTSDLLRSGCGWIVPVGDVERLTGAMADACHDPDRVLAMGRRGRQAMASFSLEQVLQQHVSLYAEALL